MRALSLKSLLVLVLVSAGCGTVDDDRAAVTQDPVPQPFQMPVGAAPNQGGNAGNASGGDAGNAGNASGGSAAGATDAGATQTGNGSDNNVGTGAGTCGGLPGAAGLGASGTGVPTPPTTPAPNNDIVVRF